MYTHIYMYIYIYIYTYIHIYHFLLFSMKELDIRIVEEGYDIRLIIIPPRCMCNTIRSARRGRCFPKGLR